jgi:Flp pilus assembly protein TadB
MMVWAMMCAAVAGALAPRTQPAVRRLERLLPAERPSSCPQAVDKSPDGGSTSALRRRGSAVLAGAACALALGGPFGLVAGVVATVICLRLSARLEPRQVRERRARLIADIPIAVDLLAACLRGGTPWGAAVEAVAAALGGPLGEELHGVAAQVRLGADPTAAWLALTREPALSELARTVARAANSGSSLAPALARLAQDQRRSARAAASARARAAGIRAVAPLGLCFLPAFVLLGIVPAVAGIAATVLLP